MSEQPQKTRGSLAKDIITLPNLISTAGYALVQSGCQEITTPQGVAKIIAGRGFDIGDGLAARLTGQESDTGAAVDAGLDKLGMLRIITASWKEDATPRPILATIAASNIINGAASIIAKARHPETSYRTPLSGKLSMAFGNAALFLHLSATAAERSPTMDRHAGWLRALGYVAFGASLPFATDAAHHYIQRARQSEPPKPQPFSDS